LLQAIGDDEGLALLTGEPGMGKTLVGHCFLNRLGPEHSSAFLTNSHFHDRTGLLQAVLYDLSQPHQASSEQELRLALTENLLKNYEAGRRTVLIVDEAQHLTPDLLEELRLLCNLEGQLGKAVQVVLLAQPMIAETLRRPELAVFRQRLAVQAGLEALGLHEAADYLVHHLRAEGGHTEAIISDEALEILARGTRGVPRLLNRAAHQALVLAFTAGARLVDAEAALEALSLVGLSDSEEATAADTSFPPLVRSREILDESPAAEGPREGVLPLGDESPADAGLNPVEPRDTSRSRRLFAAPRRPA
jgi:type II secretory pathway predicted ATPase ExeA